MLEPELLESKAHKLHAAIHQDFANPDLHLPTHYIEACRRWFESLSDTERETARSAIRAYAWGGDSLAEEIAASLPAAPRCPLLGE
jgi:hypothetical protein